jgi:hypothetical protein
MINPELANIIQMALHDDCDCKQQQNNTVQLQASTKPEDVLPTPTKKTNYIPLAIGAIILYNIFK